MLAGWKEMPTCSVRSVAAEGGRCEHMTGEADNVQFQLSSAQTLGGRLAAVF